MGEGLVDGVEEIEGAPEPLDEQEDERGQQDGEDQPQALAAPAAGAGQCGPRSVGVRRWTGGGVRLVDGAGHDRAPGAVCSSAYVDGLDTLGVFGQLDDLDTRGRLA